MRKLIALIVIFAFLSPMPVFAAASFMPAPVPQFFNSSGDPCASCTLTFYITETTTKQDTYTDATAGTANPNPLTLNSRGEWSSGIFLTGDYAYTVVLKSAGGLSTIWSRDGITGITNVSSTVTVEKWSASGLTPTYISGVSFSTVGDNRTMLESGRRIKVVVSAGTYYGRITSSSYGGGLTTTTVVLDSGALDTGISSVSVGLETPTNTALSLDSIATGTTSGNMVFTGTVRAAGIVTSTGGINSSGTITETGGIVSSGTNTWSGQQTFSGGINSSGSNTLSGTQTVTGGINSSGVNTWSGTQTFSSSVTFSNGLTSNSTMTGTATNATALQNYLPSTSATGTTIPVYNSSGRLPWGGKPAFRGALVSGNTNTVNNLKWGTIQYDTDSLITAGTQTFTVPAGITKARLGIGMQPASGCGTGCAETIIYKNGTSFMGMASARPSATTVTMSSGITSVITVTTGDKFHADTNGGTASASASNWFSIELIE